MAKWLSKSKRSTFGVRGIALIAGLVLAGVLLHEPSAHVTAAGTATLRSESVPVGWGQVQDTGLTLSAAIGALETTLSVTDGKPATTNDHRYLKVGMIIKIESEQLLITSLTDNIPDPAGLSEAPPYGDSATVLRHQGGTVAAAHALGSMIKGHYVRVPIDVTGVTYLDAGTLAGAIGSNATQASGAKLFDAATSSATILNVTDATKLVAGSVITIDSEQMAVGVAADSSGDGYAGLTEVALGSDPATVLKTPESPIIIGSCNDGIDNDLDGQTDATDSGCANVDTDGDGFTNAVETALGSSTTLATQKPEHTARTGSCTDGIDNDLDGQVDGADTGCDAADVDGDGFTGAVERALGSNPALFSSVPESLIAGDCGDLIDNDSDGNIDAKDTGCGLANTDNDNFGNTLESQLGSDPSNVAKTPENAAFSATCTDGLDNDQDGLVDGADAGCDDMDADLDGWSGFAERALGSLPGNGTRTPESPIASGTCTDGLDNDGDGSTDGTDAGCVATDSDADTFSNAVETALGSDPNNVAKKPENAAIPATCTDGVDNDGDGQMDGADTGCDDLDADGDSWSGALERALGSDPANGAKKPESPRNGNSCVNAVDDDGDTLVDSLDGTCAPTTDGDTWPDVIETALGSSTSSSSSTPEHAAIPSTCTDGVDNDGGDGADAHDASCASLDADADYVQVVRGFNGTTAVPHSAAAVITENVVDIPVSNASLIGDGSVIKIDNERMIVKSTTAGPPATAQVLRGVNGTVAASHSSGSAIQDVDGLGGAEFTITIDRAYSDLVSMEDGGFLDKCTSDTNLNGVVCGPGDVGRDVSCGTNDGDIALIESTGTTLLSAIGTPDSTLQVSDQSVFRPGMRIRIDSEDMSVKTITEGSPDTLSVYRSATPSAHSSGAAILGQNTAINGTKFTCSSSSAFPFNYGPIGDGVLAYMRVMPRQRTPVSPLPSMTLSDQNLLDVSSDTVASTLTNGKLTVSKCPDPNASGKVTQSDWLEISRAVFHIPPVVPDVNKHDLNGNNSIGDEDRLIAARILFLYSISPAECAVP